MQQGYNVIVIRQSACLFLNPMAVDNYDSFFNLIPVCRESDSMKASLKAIELSWFGTGASCLLLGPPGFNWCIFHQENMSV